MHRSESGSAESVSGPRLPGSLSADGLGLGPCVSRGGSRSKMIDSDGVCVRVRACASASACACVRACLRACARRKERSRGATEKLTSRPGPTRPGRPPQLDPAP